MNKALVGVVLGSRADFNIMRRGLESLRIMGVPYTFEMASAHRTPERVVRFAQTAGEAGIEVILCAAGGSAQIAGMLAAYTNLPVIAVPIDTTPLRGQDAMLSMIQQPPGVPIATVGINNAENAALLATQILALKHPRFRAVLAHRRMSLAQRLEGAYKELLSEYPDLCDPAKTSPTGRPQGISDEDTDPGPDSARVGSEDVTPEPDRRDSGDVIRPGAVLVHRAQGALSNAGRLIRTPQPQEPGQQAYAAQTSTEDETPSPSEDITADPDETPAGPALAHHDLQTPQLVRAPLPPTPEEEIPDTDPAGNKIEAKLSEDSNRLPSPQERSVETKVFTVDHAKPDEDVLTHAMMVLLEGGIVAFPTDTVYGLAVDATNVEAVRRLYEAKGHSTHRKSLSVLIHGPEMLDHLVRDVPQDVRPVIRSLWPGGLTILFFKKPSVLNGVSESPSIAIRVPKDNVPLELMRMVDRPLAVINAATPEYPSATTAAEVRERFDGRIDCILDAGACRGTATSTVLSILTEPYEVLREGAVPTSRLKEILGERLKG